MKNSREKGQVLVAIALVTSPILVALFLLKVFIKWSLIFYGWMKAKAMRAAGMEDD